MGPIRGQPIYFKVNNRAPLTFQEQASTEVPNQKVPRLFSHQSLSGDDPDGRGFEEQRDFRGPNSDGAGVLFKDVFNQEVGWGFTPYFRPQSPEYICSDKTFLPNIPGRCSKFPSGKRLVGEDRPSSGLFPSVCFGNSQTVFKSCLQWRNPSIDSVTFRPILGTTNVCSGNKLGGRDPAPARSASSSVPRRLPLGVPGQIQTVGTGCGNAGHFGVPGLACKLQKISDRAHTITGIPRVDLEYPGPDGGLAHSKGSGDKELPNKHLEPKQLLFERASEGVGHVKFCQPCCPSRPASLSQCTTVSKKVHPEGSESCHLSQCKGGLAVVVEGDREQFNPTTQKGSDTFPYNRRSGCGLGRPSKQPVFGRQMGPKPETLALQFKGDVCSFCSYKIPGFKAKRCQHSCSVRQQDLSSLYTESRGNSFKKFTGINNQVVGIDLSVQHNPDCIPPARKPERHCRLSIKGKTSTRVAPITTSHGGSIQAVGDTRDRPLRNKRDRRRQKLRYSGHEGRRSAILRRLLQKVGISSSVGFPTTKSHTKGTCPPEHSKRDILYNSATMDPVLLVPGSRGARAISPSINKESQRSPGGLDNRVEPSTGRQAGATSLENWGWEDKITDWSVKEQELLKRSWRPSTLSTYSAPIKRWLQWSNLNSINSKSPQGKDVARFLANLYLDNRFSYNTILLHKSAISTYCAATVENLSKNFFIQQVLKAIALERPHSNKLPVWDVNVLFNWLKSSSESNTLFEQSRRTALILLLASGRRLHDLTLLDISDQAIILTEDTVTFWPKFGSKTDRVSHRQSGWHLKKHQDESICPVTHVNKFIKMSESRRKQSRQVSSLFISIVGKVRPASKTMIAGWVRSAFKLAKIDASPGSIRSAVASRGWLDNRPVQEILDRGNWKSVETFSKYYCKEVQRPVNENTPLNLYNNFTCL